jgi:hypothetical protein
LKRYREDMIKNKGKIKTLEEKLAQYERTLRMQMEAEEQFKRQRGSVISLPVLAGNIPVDRGISAAGD